MSRNSSATPDTDPICGMTVDPSEAAGYSERDGETFHFCSRACKDRFDGGGPPEEHLCCRAS